jgi:hypothetical protein
MEYATVNMGLADKQAKEIYNYLVRKKPPSLKEFLSTFCPDISKYEGKILVRMFWVFEDSETTFQSNEVVDKADFKLLDWNKPIKLGRVNGAYSDIKVELGELIIDYYDDPFKIWQFVKTHGDFVLMGTGYLHSAVQKLKKSK